MAIAPFLSNWNDVGVNEHRTDGFTVGAPGTPRIPDRRAPVVDRPIALSSGRVSHDVGGGDRAPRRRKNERRRLPVLSRKLAVGVLHLPAGEAVLDLEVETSEREKKTNGLVAGLRRLGTPRVHHVLM